MASNLVVPQGTADLVKTKFFRFLWRNKKDIIKRSGLYQDSDRGGICMTDTNIMFKALKLAWIPRLIKSDNSKWCTIPNHFFKRMGGLSFLLRCNYDTKHFIDSPVVYKNILDNFNDLKNLYDYDQKQGINNNYYSTTKKYLIGGKQFNWSDRFKKGIISIKDLLDETSNLLTFQAFSLKYSCRTSFLEYYQVLSAIPKHLLSIAKQPDTLNKLFFTSKDNIFRVNDSVEINFGMARSRDFYNLLVSETLTHDQSGPKCWSENLSTY